MTNFWIGMSLFTVLLVLWRFCRCAHCWELVDKTEFLSPLEEAKKSGHAVSLSGLFVSDGIKLVTKVVVLVIRCPKCGAAKVLREKSV